MISSLFVRLKFGLALAYNEQCTTRLPIESHSRGGFSNSVHLQRLTRTAVSYIGSA